MIQELGIDRTAIERFCRHHGIERLALFGSALRRDFGPQSDVDVLVRFRSETRVGLILLARLQRELTELFGRPVDLVPENSLKPRMRENVLSTAETLYAA